MLPLPQLLLLLILSLDITFDSPISADDSNNNNNHNNTNSTNNTPFSTTNTAEEVVDIQEPPEEPPYDDSQVPIFPWIGPHEQEEQLQEKYNVSPDLLSLLTSSSIVWMISHYITKKKMSALYLIQNTAHLVAAKNNGRGIIAPSNEYHLRDYLEVSSSQYSIPIHLLVQILLMLSN